MYKVYCNGNLLHDSKKESLRLHNASADLEIGKTGAFSFTIYPNHPYYDAVTLLQPGIELQRDGITIFSGRALKIEYGFHNEKRVSCEGALAYLLDTLIEPDAYYGNFYGYLERLILVHNDQVEEAKQFQMGTVHVADFEEFEVTTSEYQRIYDAVNAHIVSVTGGYLQVRYEGGIKYLDVLSYTPDVSNTSAQSIVFGKNLIDVQRESDGSEVFTSILPLGDEVGGARVTIGSVNDWSNYITDEEAVAKYGLIHKVITFDGITDPQALKDAAVQYFADYYAEITNIEIAVADASLLDATLDSFLPGQWVNVHSENHFESNPTALLVKKMHVAVSNPEKTTITAGRMRKGFAESVAEATSTATATGTKLVNGDLPKMPVFLESGQDLNDLLEPGFYAIPNTTISATLLNKPWSTTATGGIYVMVEGDGMGKVQIAHRLSKDDGEIYERSYYQSAWGDWYRVHGGRGKLLWSGGYYMTASHVIALSEKVSQQQNGIVLVFSRYSGGTAQNYHWNEFFVSKEWVRRHPGTGHQFMMTNDGLFSIMCSKYLYIHDDQIGGNDVNSQSGTGTSGIIYNNAAFVLRYVIGV